ncbi:MULTISPECIES: Pycsar system effector family protein [Catenuloplanes]|uniref:Pycsar effector protein domain-containing protein n=1 Tax=Catenuloplanes niger TaxID=587534 RepID=A0AAE3ZQE5_9ACTN|nr:Pycsar system effector family protein [Catenuloplanes niger]MDR7324168.1 hypothetical protein [Catenuloplanes niger]
MSLWRKREALKGPESSNLSTDDAWKALALVNDWIKHSETKAAVSLAAAGVAGGIIFNVLKAESKHSVVTVVLASLCAACVMLAGVFAGVALWPRLRATEAPTSTLYFNHIARKYGKNSADYSKAFLGLIEDKERLVGEISQQISSNSRVATAKFFWGGLAVILLLSGLFFLGLTAVFVLAT